MTTTDTTTEDQCKYCEATPERLRLAEALESGRYQQIPRSERPAGLLRDPKDLYNITGVATAELTPSVWVKHHNTWRVHPFEVFQHTFPKMKQVPTEFAQPHEFFIQHLEDHAGPGTALGCPEETACTLGLHEKDNSTHPDHIEVNAYLLSPDEREATGIPQDQRQPYPLDLLDFSDAAKFIRRFQHFLIGRCTADDEDDRESSQ